MNSVYKLSYYIQRNIGSITMRRVYRNFVNYFLPKTKSELSVALNKALESLEKDSYVMMDSTVNETQIENILNHLKDKELEDSYDRAVKPFKVNNPPEGLHTGSYKTEDIIDCKEIFDIALSDNIVGIASHFLGCQATLSNVKVWRSYPNTEEGTNAENYHRDFDDIGFIKLFIYLTDVSVTSGPHVLIPGSHRLNKYTRVGRFSDSEIESLGIEKKVFVGPKGTCFFEDTFAIHKGQVARENGRTLLQLEYSVFPIGGYLYKEKYKGFNQNLASKDKLYTARLYWS